jgi:hypothetical protein
MPKVFIEPDGLLYEPDLETGHDRVVPASLLTEVCVGWWPPAVRTRYGEYLFVPASMMPQLADLAEGNGVPFVDRDDVWSWLLEPYLDTEYTLEDEARTARSFERCGLGAQEVAALRARVEANMNGLTFATWEWTHYGLADVLSVMRGERDYAQFRIQAFAIADRGTARVSTRQEFMRFAPKQ